MTISPALARAVRTLLQAAVAALGTVSLDAVFHGLDPQVIGLLQVVLTAAVSQLHNMLEDSGAVPTLLKPLPIPEGPPQTGEVAPAARPLRAKKPK